MSEISGREVVKELKRDVDSGLTMKHLNAGESQALLSYFEALEEVAKDMERLANRNLLTGTKPTDGWFMKGIARNALAKLRELDRPLPTFDDVKGILADGEE